MQSGVFLAAGPEDRRRLEAIVSDGNTRQKHVWRAQIVLEGADGWGTMEIMRRTPQVEDLRLALAALHGGRCRWTFALCDASPGEGDGSSQEGAGGC